MSRTLRLPYADISLCLALDVLAGNLSIPTTKRVNDTTSPPSFPPILLPADTRRSPRTTSRRSNVSRMPEGAMQFKMKTASQTAIV